ncbi:MAG: bifunctional 2-polyprenyl-6-hydroxyphenol methylase/3-demethylubiquinol 3-O-methyltransferase UbiG [Alphaproteobacteria bacterium]
MAAAVNTVDKDEIERFSRIADEWWNPHGKFAPLHRINPLRVEWIKNRIQDSGFRIQEISLLDIGCGGGLVSEAFAQLGCKVTGIDASEKNIAVAKLHAEKSGLNIDYKCATAEFLVSSLRAQRSNPDTENWIASSALPPRNDGFDVVLALEIIEHVADIPAFVECVCKLAKPGGLVIFSTINRTAKSYALAIIGAEYVLRWLPRGTHTWSKFVKPSELSRHLRANNVEVADMTGMVMNPLTWKWEMKADDMSVNYLITGKKCHPERS